uniref:hypothetical protein n=1 Tax=Salmonella sp. ZJHZ20_0179 TaxID=3159596 RepID=UPI0039790014
PVADAITSLFSGEKLPDEAKNQITELLSEQDVEPLFSGEKLPDEAKNQITVLLSEQDVEPLFRIIESEADEEAKASARQELIDN